MMNSVTEEMNYRQGPVLPHAPTGAGWGAHLFLRCACDRPIFASQPPCSRGKIEAREDREPPKEGSMLPGEMR